MKNFLFVLVILSSLLFSNLFVAAPGDGEITDSQKALIETLPPDQRASILEKMGQARDLEAELEETFLDSDLKTLIDRPEEKVLTAKEQAEYLEKSRNWIYGYEQFKSAPTTFAPTASMAVPADFMLGPGDELSIQYYGGKVNSAKKVISRSGQLNLPLLGPVTLAGLTFSEAQDLVNKRVSNELMGTSVSLTLSNLRTITVYVLGEAYSPGTYTVSALSSLTNLLFVSGGVSEKGSVRNIEVKRKGNTVDKFDLYDLLLKGDTKTDIRLQAGDVVFIPLIKKTARAEGYFRRPHLYEMKDEDLIEDLIFYAGGFTSKVTENAKLEINTINSETKKRDLSVFFSNEHDKLSQKIKDGDSLKVFEYSSLEESSITLSGEVEFPGKYSIRKGERLLEVINRAGGVSEYGYTLGAVFTRQKVAEQQKDAFETSANSIEQAVADAIMLSGQSIDGGALGPVSVLISRLRNASPIGRLVVDVDLLSLKTDPIKNILLEDGDNLYVPKRPSSIYVVGEIYLPSTHTYNSSTSIQEYVNKAGGFRSSADKSNMYVILPNGETSQATSGRRIFSRDNNMYLLPGSTIVIPRDPRPFDWLVMTRSVSPILANLATSAAALAAIDK